MLCWLCCAAGVCESSLVVCAHEHGAIIFGAGWKRDIWHFQQTVFIIVCSSQYRYQSWGAILCSLVRWPAATNNNCNYDSFCSRSTSQVIIIYKGPFTSPPSIMVAIATNILNDGSYAALTSPAFIWILLFNFGILPDEHFCKWPKILFIYLITKCVTWFQK